VVKNIFGNYGFANLKHQFRTYNTKITHTSRFRCFELFLPLHMSTIWWYICGAKIEMENELQR